MAKKEKKVECEEMAPWLITFTDVMTLMLTFFVLLVSMAKTDERRKLVVLGSIIGTFGFNDAGYDAYSVKDTKRTVEPGPIQEKDLQPLKDLLWEDVEKGDIRFESNKYVQVLSVNADLLFAPGSNTLSAGGEEYLDSILPTLLQVQNPLLLAGHASTIRDELGTDYHPGDGEKNPDLSWKISLARSLAVYQYLKQGGIPAEMLTVEGFGRFQPYLGARDAEGRRRNRRVDIVLDKRNVDQGERVRALVPEEDMTPDSITVDGFTFDLREQGGGN